jgi:hypothetical protein
LGREARIFFKAGLNRDGYFGADDLLRQVDYAIDIFEGKTKGMAQGLFLFDNAPSHQKRAANALSARKMPKSILQLFSFFLTSAWLIIFFADPKYNWVPFKDAPRMCHGINPQTGEPQLFYFPDDHPAMPGWFKGMEQIIRECGLWPEAGLHAECPGFKCLDGKTDCCCRCLLFNQPDFISQKSQLHELIESRGHICDFYPKYHCELNFIEQYWGAAKLQFRVSGRNATMSVMEKKVRECLDSVPLNQIRQ